MSILTASVSNFSLTSSWYVSSSAQGISASTPSTDSSDKTFDFTGIPAGSTINSATLTATMNSPSTGAALRTVDGGSFSGSKSVSITPGGYNTFRFRFKANGAANLPVGNRSSTLSFSNVTITVDYNPPGGGSSGGGAPPPAQAPYIGGLSVTPSTVTAGGQIYVSIGASDGNLTRHVTVYRADTGAYLATIVASHGIEAGAWFYTIPVSWCSIAPNDTQFTILIEHYAQLPGGAWGGVIYKSVNVLVPSGAVPTIGSFTAAYNANGVNGAITKYVQNYSKVDLAMGDVSEAYGSSIVSYEISGGGLSAWSSSATLGPFSQSGNITITAKAVDSRGRVGTKTVAINVEPYSPPAFSIPEAWRSNYDGVKNQKGTYVRLKSGVSFSSIGGQNAVTLKGRVYLKGGAAPAWSSMTPGQALILGGGALLFTRTYIAQMQVSDLLESRVTEFIIPTKKTGISIMAGMLGAAIGKVAEIVGILDVAWPIFAQGNPVCEFRVGGIYITADDTSPEDIWPGTEWAAIAAGTFLAAAGTGYEAGGTGGAVQHDHDLSDGFAKLAQQSGDSYAHVQHKSTASWTSNHASPHGAARVDTSASITEGVALGGTTGNGSSLPPYLAVYMWMRTA